MGLITILLPILQLILTFGNLCILLYAFKSFLTKPRDTMDQRVAMLEAEMKEVKESLLKGNDKFRTQDNALEVITRSTLALVEFEMQYCLTEHKEMSEGLRDAKKDLQNY